MILVEESTKQEAASNGHSPLSSGTARARRRLLGFFIKILSMSGRVSSARARENAADGRFHAKLRSVGKYCSLRWRVLTRAIETNWVFRGTTIVRGRDMEPSIEALKLRRMRVRNEISLSTEEGAGRAGDLEALHEELSSLSKQIEDAED